MHMVVICVFEGFDSGNGDQYFSATFQVGVLVSSCVVVL